MLKQLPRAIRSIVAIAVTIGSTLACGIDIERRTIVTRDQFGDQWPLAINSAVVECSRDGSVAILKVGSKRYALNDRARALGFPDARELSPVVPSQRRRSESGTSVVDTDELGTICRS